MLEFETLLPNLRRVGGAPLKDRDETKLRVFLKQYAGEPDSELERKRDVIRARRNPNPELGPEAQSAAPSPTWTNPHLDEAKDLILSSLIESRMKSRI